MAKLGIISLKTKINRIGREEAIRIARMAFTWCRKNIGINNRKHYEIQIGYEKTDIKNLCGEYEPVDNKITIYWNQIEDVGELIRTCVHEWAHYNQPVLTHYWKHTGIYSANPLEQKARYAERKYLDRCWKGIKHKVNKF